MAEARVLGLLLHHLGIEGQLHSPVLGYLFIGISVVDEDRVPTGGAPLIHTCPPDCDSPILWYGLSVDVR